MNQKIRNYIYSLMTDRREGSVASILQFILFLASLLYLLAIKVLFILHQKGFLPTAHLEARVISVGNLTLGGAGKTPLVELVSRCLLEKGKKVAVLTRGYRIPSQDDKTVHQHKPHLFEEIGDEPALLRLKLPQVNIIIGPDRVKNGKAAISNYGIDVLVLDDGFQYWSLSRDIDILVIDATNPFGNEMLLPRGILREPVSNLVRANIIVITKTDIAMPQQIAHIKSRLKSLNSGAPVFLSIHKPVRIVEFPRPAKTLDLSSEKPQPELDWLKEKEFVAVCGIGDPLYFIKTLQGLGAVIKTSITFEDHHPYSFQDLAYISKGCRSLGVNRVITTEKDMIKLRPLIESHASAFESFQMEFLALGIELEITENRDKFIQYLVSNER